MPEERTQQVLAVLRRVGGAAGATSETMQVGSRIVGERISLQPRPEVFNRIELWGVGRQVLQMGRAGKNALIDELALVSLEAVPDEHDRRAQLSLQMFEEIQGEFGVDVGSRMQPKVQGNPVARGCVGATHSAAIAETFW